MNFIFGHTDPSHPRNWPDSCAFKERNLALPKRSGVYAVLNARGQILYIGQAVNLRRRWLGRSHGRYPQARRVFRCRIRWQLVSRFELNEVERSLIRRFSPDWNNTPLPNRAREWESGWLKFSLLIVGAVIAGNILRQLEPFWIVSLLLSLAISVLVVLLLERIKNTGSFDLFSLSQRGAVNSSSQEVTDAMFVESFLSVAGRYGTSTALKATANAVRALSTDYDNEVPLLDCAEQLEAITEQLSD